MAEIYLQFEMEQDANLTEGAQRIQERLEHMDLVVEAEAEPSEQKLGVAEVVALITGAVVIVERGGEFVVGLRRLLREIAGLIQDINGLRGVFVEIGSERRAIDALTDEDLERLAG